MTDLFTRGTNVRREVLGDDYVDAVQASATRLTARFREITTRYVWGEIWANPILDRRTRSCITLAALAALGNDAELATHIRAARRNGLTTSEIAEVFLHTAAYCGAPAAHSALAITQKTLNEVAEEDGAREVREGEE